MHMSTFIRHNSLGAAQLWMFLCCFQCCEMHELNNEYWSTAKLGNLHRVWSLPENRYGAQVTQIIINHDQPPTSMQACSSWPICINASGEPQKMGFVCCAELRRCWLRGLLLLQLLAASSVGMCSTGLSLRLPDFGGPDASLQMLIHVHLLLLMSFTIQTIAQVHQHFCNMYS